MRNLIVKYAQPATYAERVRELEEEGLTTSDAQAVADAEQARGRCFSFDSAHPADNMGKGAQ